LGAFTTTASGQEQGTGTEKYKGVFFHEKCFIVFLNEYTQLLTNKPSIEARCKDFGEKKREMKRPQRCVSNGTLSIGLASWSHPLVLPPQLGKGFRARSSLDFSVIVSAKPVEVGPPVIA
jgi:hypothetical protein